jgi:hypothetical protein
MDEKKKVITITYKRKKRKNKRTFDFFESEFLNKIMEISAEIVYKFDKAAEDGVDLPASVPVASEYLYDSSKCILAMYEKLQKEYLIKSGVDVNNRTIH